MSQCRPCTRTATVSLWKTAFGGSLGKNLQSGSAQFGVKSTIGSSRTEIWSYKQAKVWSRQEVPKAHAVPHALRKVDNAVKLLANRWRWPRMEYCEGSG